MPFNSAGFILFLFSSAVLYWALPEARRGAFLAAASLIFYSFWSPIFAGLLLLLTLCVWRIGLLVETAAEEKRKSLLTGWGVAALAVILTAFKAAPDIFGWPITVVGLSYYTFKMISYLLDVSWGRIPAEKSLTAFTVYTTFFPQIASGPIQRTSDFLAQRIPLKKPDREMALSGLRLILWGFFKKFVIADRLAAVTGATFSDPGGFSSTALWIGAYAFYFQLYADFSGITDIAIGAGRLFGMSAPDNFNCPTTARNLPDFWRRWHITLTSWLTDYLFTPLRMAVRGWGNAGLILCIFLNMIIIGLWHGVQAHYLAFGLLQAAALSISALTLARRDKWFKRHPGLTGLRGPCAVFLTFHMVIVSFVLFKAATVSIGMTYIHGLFAGPFPLGHLSLGVGKSDLLIALAAILVMEAVQAIRARKDAALICTGWVRVAADYALLASVMGLGVFGSREFIYFKF